MRFAALDPPVDALETAIKTAIKASHGRHRSFSLLTAVPGVGRITAAARIA